MKKKTGLILALLACALLAVFLTQYRLVIVSGDSMFPTYKNGEFVLMSRNTEQIHAGDVIAFNRPDGELIKRVAALGGDTAEYDPQGGTLYVNGRLVSVFEKEPAGTKQTCRIPEDCFFVLGDNLNESIDSRYETVGLVKKEEITGITSAE